MGFKARTAAKRFMFLSIGFEKPNADDMAAWGAWFQSIADRMLDQGGFWRGGKAFSSESITDLPFAKDSVTGFVIFTATDMAEAEALVESCPVVASNQLYEIMNK